jgi:thiamine transport system ATP-binding protein
VSVEVDGATVRFGETVALDGLDLSVGDGEIVVLLGPSGCGKSTLLRAIAGLQPLDAGRIHVNGHDLAGVPPHRRGLGLMFQDQALFPHRDVRGNVEFGLRMQATPRAELRERADAVLDLVGLAGMGHRSVATLSGGEQQRVALARALAPSPQLLMLDEPLGALDRTLRDRLVSELREIFRNLGLTVLAVTHDQTEAFALADRVAVMGPGRIAQTGTAAELWDRPGSQFVARFLGFSNVAAAAISGGIARTPWGDIAVTGEGDGVLVRPSAVLLGDGPLEATVLDRTFAGDHVIVRLQVGPATLEARCPPLEAPPTGAQVRARVDPAGVVTLTG